MDLSIIVVSYNTRDLLAECLRSAINASSGLRAELVVVDNASVDGSADLVARDFPQVTLIRNADNRGFARATNQGVEASSGRHVLLMNSDATVLGDSLRHMVDFLDGNARAGIVGGKLLHRDGSFQSSYARFPRWLDQLILPTGLARFLLGRTHPSVPEYQSRALCEVDWVGGAFLMARREAIENVGLLDEDYFMYGEEMDWCYRMKQRHWQVFYLPDACAVHMLGGSAQHAPQRRRAQIYRSHWLFTRKYKGRLQAESFALVVRVLSALKLASWLVIARTGTTTKREVAQREIDSYRFLLANF